MSADELPMSGWSDALDLANGLQQLPRRVGDMHKLKHTNTSTNTLEPRLKGRAGDSSCLKGHRGAHPIDCR